MEKSLNDLQLNNSMLASLYGRSLVVTNDEQTQTVNKIKAESAGTINFLGNNSRNITILVKNTGYTYLPDAQLAFLTQVLMACRLNLDDVAIVNIAESNVIMENIIKELKPMNILSFGTGSGTELFTMANMHGTRYLNAPDLGELMQETDASKQLKGKLWAELKSMFSIK